MPRSQSSPAARAVLRLALLGSWRLERDGAPLRNPALKARALLAYLALHPGAHSREQLAALFWGDASDKQARTSLRVALTALYKLVGRERFGGDYETIELVNDSAVWVDALEFTNRDWRLETGDLGSSLQSLLLLYRGDLLPELYDDWVLRERERLRAAYLGYLEQLTSHYRAQSDYAAAIATARKLLASEPAHETAHQHLMFCLVAAGERSAALAQFAECARALRDELGVSPAPETRALYEWIRNASLPSEALAARRTNLPIPATSFIGRQRERVEIKNYLTSRPPSLQGKGELEGVRLLTLTGAGGSGKTRLAIQAGIELVDSFRDGVWWVELAPLSDGAHLASQVARALGVREQPPQPLSETTREFLQTRALLLVLDNCEHLIDDAARLAAALLSGCSQLKILATSREPLNIPGETTYALATLGLPRGNGESLAALLLEFDAVRLFVERAQAAAPQFVLTAENAAAVLEICRRLDGIPLALELAAARVRGMSVQQIAAKLHDRFNLLTRGSRAAPPRQQTLRALLDWSYELLTASERILFARASVFADGWTLEALEQSAADEGLPRGEIMDMLQRLVERSLVVADTTQAETRYAMLETIREYARLRAAETNEFAALRARFVDYWGAWLRAIHSQLWGETAQTACARVQAEHVNLRAAIGYARDDDNPERGLELAVLLTRFWKMRNYFQEAQETLYALVAHPAAPAAPHYARALSAASHIEFRRSRYAEALATAARALAAAQTLGDEHAQAEGLRTCGLAHYARKEYDRARECLQAAHALYVKLEDAYEQAAIVNDLGDLARTVGDFTQAESCYREAWAHVERIGDRYAMLIARSNVALALSAQGEYPAALAILRETALPLHELGERNMLVYVLAEIAFIWSRTGRERQAVRLFGATEALREKLGYLLLGDDHAQYQARLAGLAQLVPAPDYAREWAHGQALALEQVLAWAVKSD